LANALAFSSSSASFSASGSLPLRLAIGKKERFRSPLWEKGADSDLIGEIEIVYAAWE
jgi:hypothetical protein